MALDLCLGVTYSMQLEHKVLGFLPIEPPVRYTPPVTEHMPLHSKSFCKNMFILKILKTTNNLPFVSQNCGLAQERGIVITKKKCSAQINSQLLKNQFESNIKTF